MATTKRLHTEFTNILENGDKNVLYLKNTVKDVVTGDKSNISIEGKILFSGECSTSGYTVAKSVTINGFSLVSGAHLTVKFINGISVANSTLSVNSSTAIPIYLNGERLEANVIKSNSYVTLMYDGSRFNIVSSVGGGDISKTLTPNTKLYILGSSLPSNEDSLKEIQYVSTAYIDTDGSVHASSLYGDGSHITNIDASNITGNIGSTSLSNSGVTAGQYGDNSSNTNITLSNASRNISVPSFNVNSKGLITNAQTKTYTIPRIPDNMVYYGTCSDFNLEEHEDENIDGTVTMNISISDNTFTLRNGISIVVQMPEIYGDYNGVYFETGSAYHFDVTMGLSAPGYSTTFHNIGYMDYGNFIKGFPPSLSYIPHISKTPIVLTYDSSSNNFLLNSFAGDWSTTDIGILEALGRAYYDGLQNLDHNGVTHYAECIEFNSSNNLFTLTLNDASYSGNYASKPIFFYSRFSSFDDDFDNESDNGVKIRFCQNTTSGSKIYSNPIQLLYRNPSYGNSNDVGIKYDLTNNYNMFVLVGREAYIIGSQWDQNKISTIETSLNNLNDYRYIDGVKFTQNYTTHFATVSSTDYSNNSMTISFSNEVDSTYPILFYAALGKNNINSMNHASPVYIKINGFTGSTNSFPLTIPGATEMYVGDYYDFDKYHLFMIYSYHTYVLGSTEMQLLNEFSDYYSSTSPYIRSYNDMALSASAGIGLDTRLKAIENVYVSNDTKYYQTLGTKSEYNQVSTQLGNKNSSYVSRSYIENSNNVYEEFLTILLRGSSVRGDIGFFLDGSSVTDFTRYFRFSTNASSGFHFDKDIITSSNVGAVSFNQTSSRKYKENIIDMPDDVGREILSLNPVVFDYKDGRKDCKGLIAEDAYEIDKYQVSCNEDNEPDSIDYSKYVAQLIKMVQIQQKEIDQLKKDIQELKG